MPHPDDAPPSQIHMEKFKELFYNYDNDRWDEFEEAVAIFTSGLQNHVKISINPNATFTPRSINENNPTVIQRLYRRNPRRAIWTIQGDTGNIC